MSASRQMFAQAAAWRLLAAACREQAQTWTRQERAHDAATTQVAAQAAAEPLLHICACCPIVTECRAWAVADEYTGIAAGTAWVNGVEQPVHWVRRHPPRRRAS